MEKQHLTYFKIENFKRFDSFEMSNLGQFNLIVGDNNVGKTSVLEGLLFDEDISVLAASFLAGFVYRSGYNFKEYPTTNEIRNSNFWTLAFKNPTIPISIEIGKRLKERFILEVKSSEELNQEDKQFIDNELFLRNTSTFFKQVHYDTHEEKTVRIIDAYLENVDRKVRIPDLIPTNLSYSEELHDLFYAFINPDKALRKEVEEHLRMLIPNLEEIRIHRFAGKRDILSIVLTDSNSIYPLYQFGDGTVKFARLLIHLIITKNHRLMIDEIGSGIHFTRLTSYWKTIIQLCDKYQVQLFATTHSLECQQAFIEALEDPEMVHYQKDARNISLVENKEGEVKAVTFDFEQFEYALNIGFNTRGGVR